MFSSKKALENYILTLGVIGIIMSFLLVYFLGYAFGTDHPKCQQLDFEFEIVCKDRGLPRITVQNSASDELFFMLNGEKSVDKYRVEGGDSKLLRFQIREGTEIELLPLVRTDNIFHECRGRAVKKDSAVVPIC